MSGPGGAGGRGFTAVILAADREAANPVAAAAGVACKALAPVARTPSTGPGSMASTASANSLARTPVVLIHNASTPAKGPRPTATTNNMANTISLIERKASITRRSGWCTHHGVMLSAHKMPSGTEQTMANTVPQRAICTVTIISLR